MGLQPIVKVKIEEGEIDKKGKIQDVLSTKILGKGGPNEKFRGECSIANIDRVGVT